MLFPPIELPQTCKGTTEAIVPPFEEPWQAAIMCSDSGSPTLNKTALQVKPVVDALYKQSWFGAGQISMVPLYCTGWTIKGKLRFTGESIYRLP